MTIEQVGSAICFTDQQNSLNFVDIITRRSRQSLKPRNQSDGYNGPWGGYRTSSPVFPDGRRSLLEDDESRQRCERLHPIRIEIVTRLRSAIS